MSVLDSNWARWITASIHKSIKDKNALFASPYTLFFEGAERKTNQVDAFIEVRVGAPKFNEQSKDYWVCSTWIDLLVACQQDNDLYRIDRMIGDATKWLDDDIAVLKLGNGTGDDQSSLGCLRRDEPGGISPHKFGLVAPKSRLLQAAVVANFWIALP